MEAFVALIKSLVELLKDPVTRAVLAAIAATWFVGMLATNAVVAMERPTDSSSAGYRYWFKFLNGVVGSWKRVEKQLHVPGAEDEPVEK